MDAGQGAPQEGPPLAREAPAAYDASAWPTPDFAASQAALDKAKELGQRNLDLALARTLVAMDGDDATES